MAKTPVVQAQQKWEYMYFQRKSEPALYNELVVVGADGWELVQTHLYKDPKGVMTWIAFLKRPCSGAVPVGSPMKASASAPATSGPSKPAHEPLGFDMDGDLFELKKTDVDALKKEKEEAAAAAKKEREEAAAKK